MTDEVKLATEPGPFEVGLFTIADLCEDGSLSSAVKLGIENKKKSRLPGIVQCITPAEVDFIAKFTRNYDAFVRGPNFSTMDGSLFEADGPPVIIKGKGQYEKILITGAVAEQLDSDDPSLESMWAFYFQDFGIVFETYFSDFSNSIRTYIIIVPPYENDGHPINWVGREDDNSFVTGFVDNHVVSPIENDGVPENLSTVITLDDMFVDGVILKNQDPRSLELTLERFSDYRMAIYMHDFLTDPENFRAALRRRLRNLYGFNKRRIEGFSRDYGADLTMLAVKKTRISDFLNDLSLFYDFSMQRFANNPALYKQIDSFLKAVALELNLWPVEYTSKKSPNTRTDLPSGILKGDLDELQRNTFRRH